MRKWLRKKLEQKSILDRSGFPSEALVVEWIHTRHLGHCCKCQPHLCFHDTNKLIHWNKLGLCNLHLLIADEETQNKIIHAKTYEDPYL